MSDKPDQPADEQEPTPATAVEDAHDHDHDHDEEEFSFVEDPTFDVDYKGECAYEVKVSVPPANRKAQADEMYEELQHEAEVPGFRRGKAPKKLIERKFGKAVKSEVEGKLVQEAFKKLLDDEDLNPIGPPDIDGLEELQDLPEGEALAFTVKFEVAPRVTLGKYRGIEIERPVLKVDDKDINHAVDDLRERHAVYETNKRVKAKEGDQVVIDFKGTIDGEEFQGGSAEGYPYILGTKRFFPEFEEVLVGSKTGDELNCEVTLPDNTPDENLRGKTATFAITVSEIKRKKEPKLDDEFAKQAGYESVDDLKEKLAEQLRAGADSQSQQAAEAHAMDAVIESSEYEIPGSLVKSISEDLYQEQLQQLTRMRIPRSDLEEREEELRKSADENAVRDIKRLVALNEIGEAEGVEVTDEDFEQEAELLAARTGLEMDMVSQYLSQEDQRNSYESRIFRAKALKVVIDNAKITDKEVARKELETHDDAEASESDD
jgi:trigger factor